MNDNAKRCTCMLTGAALFLSWIVPAEKAAAVPASTIMLEMVCEDIRPRIAAAPNPESHVGRQMLEQPEAPHVEPAVPALPPPPLLPFVPQEDDGWQALRLHYVQPETNMAALLASGAFGQDAIVPPPVPFVQPNDPQAAVPMRYDHSYVNMAALVGDAAILPPEEQGHSSDS